MISRNLRRNQLLPANCRIGRNSFYNGQVRPYLLEGVGQPSLPGGSKLVRFGGYTVSVPAGWPVYSLAADPSRCVRFGRHAVYLGQPGLSQRCPAHQRS